ncbi:unnamed protein product [Diplocarpon coronariae]
MPEHRALWRNNNNIAKASLSNDINNREHLPTETQLEIPTSISELPGTANSLSDTSNLSKWSPVTPSSKREDATILDLAKAFLEAKQVKAKSEIVMDTENRGSDLRPADLNLTNFNRALAKNASNVKVEEVAVMKEILGLVPKTKHGSQPRQSAAPNLRGRPNRQRSPIYDHQPARNQAYVQERAREVCRAGKKRREAGSGAHRECPGEC